MSMVRKNVLIWEETVEKLKVIQKEQGRTFASLVREGLRLVIKKHYNKTTASNYDPTSDSFN